MSKKYSLFYIVWIVSAGAITERIFNISKIRHEDFLRSFVLRMCVTLSSCVSGSKPSGYNKHMDIVTYRLNRPK